MQKEKWQQILNQNFKKKNEVSFGKIFEKNYGFWNINMNKNSWTKMLLRK